MPVFTLTNTGVLVLSLCLAHRLYWEATTGKRRRRLAHTHACLPPKARLNRIFPRSLPTFGLDFVLSNWRAFKNHRLLSEWNADLHAADAHTLAIPILGTQLFLTDDAENVKAMLAVNFEAWSIGKERIDIMSSYLGHGIFTTEGAAWKKSRETLRPCFARSAVAETGFLERHCQTLMGLVPDDGSEVDLQPLLFALTFDIASEFLFGRSVESLAGGGGQDVRDFVEAFEYCNDPMKNEGYEKWGYVGLFLPDRKWKRSVKVLQEFTDSIIASSLAAKETSPSDNDRTTESTPLLDPSTTTTPNSTLLNLLTTSTTDPILIRSELLNILLAGRDTTGSLLSNILWSLSHHPSIQIRLYNEIINIVGPSTTPPTYEQLKQMPYLRAIVNESQRLHPIVPSNSREALSDTVLPRGGGPDGQSPVLVPRGSYVMFHSYSMHRRLDLYTSTARCPSPSPPPSIQSDSPCVSDAETFNPSRWLEPGFRPGWAYVPFSGGPRVCIGQNFALTEAMYVVARVVGAFEIVKRDEGVWREKITITCVGEGCRVGLRRRKEM